MKNTLLADLIYYFHICIIAFVLFAPICGQIPILILHIVFCISLLLHWATNQNICCLTVLEGQLRGMPYDKGVIHRFIGPIYDVSKTTFSKISYIVVLIVMSISIISLINTKKFKGFLACCRSLKDKSFNERICGYIKCFMPLFQFDL